MNFIQRKRVPIYHYFIHAEYPEVNLIMPCRVADCVNLTHRYTKYSHIYVNVIQEMMKKMTKKKAATSKRKREKDPSTNI